MFSFVATIQVTQHLAVIWYVCVCCRDRQVFQETEGLLARGGRGYGHARTSYGGGSLSTPFLMLDRVKMGSPDSLDYQAL